MERLGNEEALLAGEGATGLSTISIDSGAVDGLVFGEALSPEHHWGLPPQPPACFACLLEIDRCSEQQRSSVGSHKSILELALTFLDTPLSKCYGPSCPRRWSSASSTGAGS